MISVPEGCSRPFLFERDTLAFANELVWQYRFDPITGSMVISRRDRRPTYSHRCFVMVRAVRQFLYHAQFDPALPPTTPDGYRCRVREIISRNPRRMSAASERIVIPGHPDLRSFSEAEESLLKSECGGAWESYFVRSHWRMVFPVSNAHQERTARRLEQSLSEGRAPVVHLFRFPHVAINHAVVLFGATASRHSIEFDVYDPNIPERSLRLTFERAASRFTFPRTHYWEGGPVSVNEVLRNSIY
jgi:hypothetical protein